MRPPIRSVLILLALSKAFAAAAEPRQITVRVFDTASVRQEILANAQNLAAQLYERVGIQILWVRGDRDTLTKVEREQAIRTSPGCASVDRIDVKLQLAVRGLTRSTILASASPYRKSGIRVRVPMANVVGHARATGVPIDVILGFVLTHEIGHVLIGSDWHSRTGIMRAKLNWIDMIVPPSQVPMFDAIDTVYIRRNLEQSSAGCQALAAAR